jgi:hypothetical protein
MPFALLLIVLALYAAPALLTASGSRHRGNARRQALLEGLGWPVTWVAWFVIDNKAAGRPRFQGHTRS